MMRWSETWQTEHGTVGSGVVVNVASRDLLLADLEQRLADGQGFSVATLNLDHVTKLRALPDFKEAYQRQTHVTADGNPIVWFSRLAGQDVSLVPGSELIEPVTEIATRLGFSIALFGATQASLDAAAKALKARFPEVKVATTLAPPMGFDPAGPAADGFIKDLAASGARVCFLALGAPKQEIFAARARTQIPDMGFLSIGAGLDFISGSQVRAPRIVRAFAGEWLWRLAHDPRRLARRYGACIAVLPGLMMRALKARYQAGTGDML
jgi:exopolysaccharide biosynthesis WecB/TagA/CpsF family protein